MHQAAGATSRRHHSRSCGSVPLRAQEINAGPPGGCYARRVGRPDPLSQLQNKPLDRASAAPGSDCVEAAPLAGSARLDTQHRAAAPDADPVATHRAANPAAQTAAPPAVLQPETAAASGGSRFLRACLRLPTDRTPVWFLRQAGRYMPEYRAVRRRHTLLDICRTPALAAEVTITAAERLGVDAAIIFADLLLPFTPMGLDFEFVADEGPRILAPIRTAAQARALRTDRTEELLYVARAIEIVARHFAPPRADGDQLGIIGFCGAPFTLASYMIEGGSSRNYIETKRLMFASTPPNEQRTTYNVQPSAWPILMDEARHRPRRFRRPAGRRRRRRHPGLRLLGRRALPHRLSPVRPRPHHRPHRPHPRPRRPRHLLRRGHRIAPPRHARDRRRRPRPRLAHPARPGLARPRPRRRRAGQPRPHRPLRPARAVLHARVAEVLAAAAGRPGHIFNLGHGIVPTTPVDAVLAVVDQIKSGTP